MKNDRKVRITMNKKDILEIFDLYELWSDLFNEELKNENKIVLATNKFKPDEIIIGQGYIGARDKQSAIEWLKIVKTSLILLDNDGSSLKSELDNLDDENLENDSGMDISNTIGNFFD